jgi:copper(I)-binding protein
MRLCQSSLSGNILRLNQDIGSIFHLVTSSVAAVILRPLSGGAAALLPLLVASALAGPPVPDLAIMHAWSRATAPGSPAASAYLTIENRGTSAARLTSARSPAAREVAVHATRLEGAMAGMHAASLIVPAHGQVQLTPGGMHLMLMGLSAPLVAGSHIELSLTFEPGGVIAVTVPVLAADSAGP